MERDPSEVWEPVGAPPLAHNLKHLLPDRWVRFYSLPEGKRYAETPAEYETLLLRANTIIGNVCGLGTDLMMAAGEWVEPGKEPTRGPALIEVQPDPVYWREVLDPFDEDRWPFHLWVSWVVFEPGVLDRAIRLCANEDVDGLLLVSPERGTVVHHYDGGLDVIMPTPQERNDLRLRYIDWASPRPDGF